MSLQMLGKDCASTRILRSVIDHSRATKEVDEEIYDACVSMIQQFQSLCDQKKVLPIVLLLSIMFRLVFMKRVYFERSG